MKSVLVTGATGFIGRATVTALKKAGWRVVQGTRSDVSRFTSDTILLDLSQPVSILALEKKVRFDAIVHLGARIGWSGEKKSAMFVPNVLSTGCLAVLAKAWGAQLVYTSAAIVHGVRQVKIDIESPLFPDTEYAECKLLGEQLVIASGASHCILRIAGVFGAAGPWHLGLNRAIDGALKGVVPMQVGSGKALRNYIYVKDVAAAVLHVLESRLKGTHLLAGTEVLSINEMLKLLCDIFVPGEAPILSDGRESEDQIIAPSELLPETHSFKEAISSIKSDNPSEISTPR